MTMRAFRNSWKVTSNKYSFNVKQNNSTELLSYSNLNIIEPHLGDNGKNHLHMFPAEDFPFLIFPDLKMFDLNIVKP